MQKVTLYCGVLENQEIKTTDSNKFSNFFKGYHKDVKRYTRFNLKVPIDRLESTMQQDVTVLWEYKKKKQGRENNLYTKG